MGSSGADNLVFGGIAAAWIAGIVMWMLRSRRRSQGKSISNGVGIVFAGLVVIWLAYVGSGVFRCARLKAEQITCQMNMKTLANAMLQYAEDHNEHLPPANAWATDILPYLAHENKQKIFQCPDAISPYSYAFNGALGGKSLEAISKPADTVMLFESDAATINTSGSAADFDRDRHVGMANVAYADGHVRTINSYTIATLIWKL
jgi:prepilin-type processing-associated H-X9-DG protein